MFDQLAEKIQLTEDDRIRFRSRADDVREALIKTRLTDECFLIGSLNRGTALQDFSDVDLLAVVDPICTDNSRPADVLPRLASALTQRGEPAIYGKIAVTVTYPDNPSVDVLPARSLQEDNTFLIPAYGDIWRRYKPSELDTLVESTTDVLGPRVRRLIQLIKYWNNKNAAGLISSDLEEIACIVVLKHHEMPSYLKAFAEIFEFLLDWTTNASRAVKAIDRTFPIEPTKRIRSSITQSLSLVSEYERLSPGRDLLKELFGANSAN
ncbi:hypothetical protein OG205_24455 [Lentzea sp. NBC_00516]|uniref:SMODS domain-containing nucleotidyltransferase n=1 Tax=Lentzea sp. NBC_00516 TaxID=2903582 RepID=UPI002E80F61C|nr:hypothetical protein [Lentzea sp. NBC_00516]WUD21293.1 hypothetical protein OG205_24455 [Lentzea sp. NBC_00516]